MSEMKDRVARALYEKWAAGFNLPKKWDDAHQQDRKDFLEIAHIAIGAMREPTEAMVDAADDTDALCWSLEPGEGLDAVIWSVAWKAMIDEALK